MGIELIFLCVALISVVLTRGSFRALLTTKFNHTWTLVAALSGHLAITFAPIEKSQYDSVGLAILLFTYVMLFGFCSANINIRGMWIVLAGITCNAVAIGLNSGMPVTTEDGFTVKETIKHQPATSQDLAPFLTDIIPVNPLSLALSVGDILFALGLIYVCIAASRKPRVEESDEVEIVEIEKDNDVAAPLTAKEMIEEMEESILIDLTSSPSRNEDTEVVLPAEPEIAPAALRSSFRPMSPKRNEVIAERESRVMPTTPVAPSLPSAPPVVEPAAPVIETAEQVVVEAASEPKPEPVVKPQPIAQKEPTETEKLISRSQRRNKTKKWKQRHGLAALPSKEELGFDETVMQEVDAAQ